MGKPRELGETLWGLRKQKQDKEEFVYINFGKLAKSYCAGNNKETIMKEFHITKRQYEHFVRTFLNRINRIHRQSEDIAVCIRLMRAGDKDLSMDGSITLGVPDLTLSDWTFALKRLNISLGTKAGRVN